MKRHDLLFILFLKKNSYLFDVIYYFSCITQRREDFESNWSELILFLLLFRAFTGKTPFWLKSYLNFKQLNEN